MVSNVKLPSERPDSNSHLTRTNSRATTEAILKQIANVTKPTGIADAFMLPVTLPLNLFMGGMSAVWKSMVTRFRIDVTSRLDDKDPVVRKTAATGLGWLGGEAQHSIGALAARLDDQDPNVRKAAAESLGAIGLAGRSAKIDLAKFKFIIDALAMCLVDDNMSVEKAAADSLRRIGLTQEEIDQKREDAVWDRFRKIIVQQVEEVRRYGGKMSDEEEKVLSDSLNLLKTKYGRAGKSYESNCRSDAIAMLGDTFRFTRNPYAVAIMDAIIRHDPIEREQQYAKEALELINSSDPYNSYPDPAMKRFVTRLDQEVKALEREGVKAEPTDLGKRTFIDDLKNTNVREHDAFDTRGYSASYFEGAAKRPDREWYRRIMTIVRDYGPDKYTRVHIAHTALLHLDDGYRKRFRAFEDCFKKSAEIYVNYCPGIQGEFSEVKEHMQNCNCYGTAIKRMPPHRSLSYEGFKREW